MLTRRSALKVAAATALAPTVIARPRGELLSVACVGVGGRGGGNLGGVAGENVIALCDVDAQRAAGARERKPEAAWYTDYRELLDALGDKLDAIVVSTPDHMHAPIGLAGMRLGLHCYCEKPLTWSIQEARLMNELAAEKGLVTQMGNQGTASGGLRTGVEALRADIVGEVTQVHLWTNRPIWPQAVERPAEAPPAPETLDWDLFLGCAEERPYHPAYHPFKWRGWLDFGTGALGDMACHTMNLVYLGLELGQPLRVEAETTPRFAESYPAGGKVTFHFPARGAKPPVALTWYEGSMRPPAGLLGPERELPGSGCLVVGSEGTLYSPDNYGTRLELTMNDGSEPPPMPAQSLPRSPGHHAEWLRAIRGEGPRPMSHFGHAGPFTEAVLVGDLALRLGRSIQWDAENLRAVDVPSAEPLVRRQYRAGFGIE